MESMQEHEDIAVDSISEKRKKGKEVDGDEKIAKNPH
jgi:hypothetical protein